MVAGPRTSHGLNPWTQGERRVYGLARRLQGDPPWRTPVLAGLGSSISCLETPNL